MNTRAGGPLAAALLLAAGSAWPPSAGTAQARFDPPRIVFNKSIGDIRLGMTRDQVEHLYGGARAGDSEVFRGRDYFPIGTRYAGKTLHRVTYRRHSGTLIVSYVGGRVKVVQTTSLYYRTISGVRVGLAIPLGACHRNK